MTNEGNTSQQWRLLGQEERLQRIHGIFICFPRLRMLLDEIDRHAQRATTLRDCRSERGECLALVGESGSGKSTLLQFWLEEKRRETHQKSDERPLPYLHTVVPAYGGRKGLFHALLNSGSVIVPSHSTSYHLENAAYAFLRDQPTDVLILDNCDGFVDKENQRIRPQLFEAVEDIIRQTGTSTVMLCSPTTLTLLLHTSPFLERRLVSHQLTLFLWNHTEPEAIQEFRQFLHTLDQALPFDPSALGETMMAWRFFYATEGRIASIMHLIRYAAQLALHANSPKIERQFLARAYDLCIAETPAGSQKMNPFDPEEFREKDW